MNSITREVNISGANINDQVAAMLQAFCYVKDTTMIKSISIPGIDPNKIYTIKIDLQEEVVITQSNAKMAKKL